MIIKTKLLTQSKTESFFIDSANIEPQGTKYKNTKVKLKEDYEKFKMITVHRLQRSIFKCFLKPLRLHKKLTLLQ